MSAAPDPVAPTPAASADPVAVPAAPPPRRRMAMPAFVIAAIGGWWSILNFFDSRMSLASGMRGVLLDALWMSAFVIGCVRVARDRRWLGRSRVPIAIVASLAVPPFVYMAVELTLAAFR